MGMTNFAALTPEQKLVWARDVWSAAREQMFINKFMGTGDGAMIQRITELTRTEKGDQCIMHLVADLVGDGVVGDNEREGNEEELKSYSDTITIDLISNQVANKGKMADQKTVIKFREQARDKLAYWVANRADQLAFLTLSGISYAYNLDGTAREGSQFANLAFAKDVHAPTTNRARRWDATNGLVAADTTALDATDVPAYATIVEAAAYAKDHYIKPLVSGGKEYYCLFLSPRSLAKLKRDPDYQRAITQAGDRGKDNPWFTGGTVTIDGVVIHETRNTYTTKNAASGQKWGSGGTVDGSRMLLCGAQALGFADLGAPEWDEKTFNYNARVGISVDKMFGLLKPQFYSIYDKSVEDFGCLTIDVAL